MRSRPSRDPRNTVVTCAAIWPRSFARRCTWIRERAFGAEHEEVAQSIGGLASLRVDQGAYQDAYDLYTRCLTILANVAGEDHPLYASNLANRSIAETALRNVDRARESMEKVVEIQRRNLAADDLDLAWSLGWLGSLYEWSGLPEQALRFASEALAVQEAAIGPDHTNVAETLNVIANLHRRAGDLAAALALRERTATIWERALGPDHPTLAMALDHIARDLRALGRSAEAIPVSTRAGGIFRRALPEGHPSMAINSVVLGQLHLDVGDLATAREHLEQALALRKLHRSEHPEEIEEIVELRRGPTGSRAEGVDRVIPPQPFLRFSSLNP